MVRRLCIAVALALLPAVAYAHLCNDVFAQARDNLVVKVDVRDGQLRIGQEGSFRVYLLNTMDREITAIALQVLSDHFDARVEPAPTWQTYPVLKTSISGGKKEYFTVTLRRKPGVPDGRYRLDLQLSDKTNSKRVFKTVDATSAADLCVLQPAKAVQVDGRADAAEWEHSVLCSDFYVHKKVGSFFENVRADAQARCRLAMDADSLYALLQFQGGEAAVSDVGTIYLASDPDAAPVAFSFDRVSGRMSSEQNAQGVQYAVSPDKTLIECKIPRALLRQAGQAQDPPGYYVNLTRTTSMAGQKQVAYWRGNSFSVLNPIVYGYVTIGGTQQPVQ